MGRHRLIFEGIVQYSIVQWYCTAIVLKNKFKKIWVKIYIVEWLVDTLLAVRFLWSLLWAHDFGLEIEKFWRDNTKYQPNLSLTGKKTVLQLSQSWLIEIFVTSNIIYPKEISLAFTVSLSLQWE